ncbi:MAG: DNA polymerase III subunit delta' [Gammaproteobacteria bacterium]|nr:MAG: DNA polymerase III subunit delta' [Gammaproteobacteria bacterium]
MTVAAPYPWLTRHLERVGELLRQGRMPHALLVTGRPGLGKLTFATSVAALLICEDRGNGHVACGKCRACCLQAAGNHPDYFHVTLPVDEKTGKVGTVIKVDQIRALSERLTLSRHGAGHKVALLEPADALNINAANSLLKTLEEPADNTVLVLVSAQPGRLPPTVRSRCQQIRIDAPATDAALGWLAGQYDGPRPEVFLRLADGAPLRALALAQENALEERRERFDTLVGLCNGSQDPVAVAQAWAKDEDLKGLGWMRDWIMDLLKIRMTGKLDGIHGIDLADRLQRLASKLESRVLFGQLDRVNRTLQLTDSSLNRQMMMEDVLLAWADTGATSRKR